MMVLVGVFAALAVLLAAVGIYGVMTYSVAQRTSEIGVRMALGAGSGHVLWLILRHTIRLVGIGVLVASPEAWRSPVCLSTCLRSTAL